MTAGGARISYPFSAVVGQDQLRLALMLLSVDPGIGGVLIRGQKGTAKTTTVRGLAELVPVAGAAAGAHAPFVELPLGATEDRVVGSLDLDELVDSGRPRFRPGLLGAADGGVLYVDEVNLLADHLVDVLLDSAATGQLTVERDGISHTASARYALVGTMNPEEGELRPQLLDRFGLTVDVHGPEDPRERVEIVSRRRAFDADPAAFAAGYAAADRAVTAEIARARAVLAEVSLPDREMMRIALVCMEIGVEGMRADVVIARTATAHAALAGRTEVTEDDIRAAASGLLKAELRENFIGYAEIREVFRVSGVGNVAGCLVTEGVARRSAGVRLLRDNVVIHEGTLKTLKRFKDEVKEVQSGQECGMAFENYEDIRPGDVIEIFEREEVERKL